MSNTSTNILATITSDQWAAIAEYAAQRAAGKLTLMHQHRDEGQNHENKELTEEQLSTDVTNLLHMIGAKPNIKGYRYLREAVIMVYGNWDYMEAITKALYPEIAKKFNTTGSRVERAIRHSIEVIFQYSDMEVLSAVFSCSPCAGKPTNSEAIASMVVYLKKK